MSKERFDRTVAILVKAFLNNTLEHGNCYACAVGNIVADRLGLSLIPKEKGLPHWSSPPGTLVWADTNCYPANTGWGEVFCTTRAGGQRFTPHAYEGLAKQQIDSTGYSCDELAKVEFAFETADRGESDHDWMFNGLMAVVAVLAEIDGIDLETTEAARKLFVKA